MLRHIHTLGALAEALVPYLQHYSKDHNLLWDTSVFVANSTAQCLPGCSCASCSSSDQGSAGEEEWMDFDFSAYAGAEQSPHSCVSCQEAFVLCVVV